jgi:hypothetical protein
MSRPREGSFAASPDLLFRSMVPNIALIPLASPLSSSLGPSASANEASTSEKPSFHCI